MNPKFTGVWIPAEVLALDISLMAKIAFGIVDSLDNEDGCFASNGYLSKTLSVTERQVRSILKELEDKNLIKRIVNGGSRTIRTVSKIALCKAIDTEENFLEEENFQDGRKETSAGGGRKLPPYSKEDNKEDIKEKWVPSPIPFPSTIFINTWNSWIDYRKEIKKPLKKSTINAQFETFKLWGEEQSILSIRNSIASGWVGLFEPRKNNYGFQAKPLTSKDHDKF